MVGMKSQSHRWISRVLVKGGGILWRCDNLGIDMPVRTPRNTEVDAYVFIKENLKELGWDVRNPLRVASGQVYTQNECLSEPEIKQCLNLDRPENIVKVTESTLWVIEAKREHRQLDQALEEAEGYARRINKSRNFKVKFISGVAGNAVDSYLIATKYLVGDSFVPITLNEKAITSLLSVELAKKVLEEGAEMADVPVDETFFLGKAEKINTILHLGAINKNQRARVMAALLLSLVDDTPPNIDASPSVLIGDINNRARRVLAREGKTEFYRYIEIALPPTEDNHIKFKKALVQTLQELNNLNIRSAMNSGTDVLGKFYEVFLRYGNGAKEIGIVLTPRHITQFAVEVSNVTSRDLVLDPTCGTGGFLVAAFDHVKATSGSADIERFKENNLFGIDQEVEVVALALVNMIFRGDGKNNIVEGNCFQKSLIRTTKNGEVTAEYSQTPPTPEQQAITRVLMNPPFALKENDEKEYKFVEHALKQMVDGGILFAVLPYSAMVKPGGYKTWRTTSLLANNTLLSVITLPEDLFYPVGVHTVGIFVRKGTPHPKDQNVLWVRATNDGLLKRKGKRLPSSRAKDDYPVIKEMVRSFLIDPSISIENKEKFQKACPVDMEDPLMELVPENYLDQAELTSAEVRAGIERVVRDAVAFSVSNSRADRNL